VQPKHPGAAEEGSAMFCREHTLSRLRHCTRRSRLRPTCLASMRAPCWRWGHSEGAMVVCHLPARNARVTHVAAFAGGGPTQLYDLLHVARERKFGPPDGDAAARVAWLTAEWKKVLTAPDADNQFFLGHPHRRWTTFATAPTIPTLLASNAAVFLAYYRSPPSVVSRPLLEIVPCPKNIPGWSTTKNCVFSLVPISAVLFGTWWNIAARPIALVTKFVVTTGNA
jgi:hypothetical protein